MAPKTAESPVKRGRGRGRPPKASTVKPPVSKATPAKRRGRPPGSKNTSKATTAIAETTPSQNVPSKKKPGRPAKTTSAPQTTNVPAKRRGRPPGSTKPIADVKPTGVKKRGRPIRSGGSSSIPSTQAAPTATSVAPKRGRPKGAHAGNLSPRLGTLIRRAPKERLVDLLAALCARNQAVARAAGDALREQDGEEGQDVEDASVGKQQGAEAPEPASGYDADVEPEVPVPATTEAVERQTPEQIGDGNGSAETATEATEATVQAVEAVRDSAFKL